MLPLGQILVNAAALAAVWLAAVVPGLGVAALLPRALRPWRLAVAPLLGLAWWASALYLLPFAGGMWVAWILALCAGAAGLWAWRRDRASPTLAMPAGARRRRQAAGVLALGALPYLTPLLVQYAPIGVDATRYPVSARLIAAEAHLPSTWAPMEPIVPFGVSNHGAAALAAAATMLGAVPTAAVLAVQHLAFTGLILAVFCLLLLAARPPAAAVVAVGAVWGGNCIQTTISWGGWTTPLGVAMGVLSARLLVDLLRRGELPAAIPTGLLTGAMLLVQGTAAGGWAYMAAPLAVMVGLGLSRRRGRGLVATAAAAGVAGVVAGAYLGVGRPSLSVETVAFLYEFQAYHAPRGDGVIRLANACIQVIGSADLLAVLAIAGVAVLMVRRRRLAPAVCLASVALLAMASVNYDVWALPGSLLLYPERLVHWATPLAALPVAAAWGTIRLRRRRTWCAAACAGLLLLGLWRNAVYYQPTALTPAISPQGWRGLLWCRDNLDPRRHCIHGAYETAGMYTPAVAGIFSTGCHLHADQCFGVDWSRGRPITHVFRVTPRGASRRWRTRSDYDRVIAPVETFLARHPGRVVFSDDGIEIIELDQPVPRASNGLPQPIRVAIENISISGARSSERGE